MGEGGEVGIPSSSLPGEVITAPAEKPSEDIKTSVPVELSIATKHLPALDALAAMSWTGEMPKNVDRFVLAPQTREEKSEIYLGEDPNTEFARKSIKFRTGPYLTLDGLTRMLENEPEGHVRNSAIKAYSGILEHGGDSMYQAGLDEISLNAALEMGADTITKFADILNNPKGRYFRHDIGEEITRQLWNFADSRHQYSSISYDLVTENPAAYQRDNKHTPDGKAFTNRRISVMHRFAKFFPKGSHLPRPLSVLYIDGIIDRVEDLSHISDKVLLNQRNIGEGALKLIREKYPYIDPTANPQPSASPTLDSL